jgi:hypothetical protein
LYSAIRTQVVAYRATIVTSLGIDIDLVDLDPCKLSVYIVYVLLIIYSLPEIPFCYDF